MNFHWQVEQFSSENEASSVQIKIYILLKAAHRYLSSIYSKTQTYLSMPVFSAGTKIYRTSKLSAKGAKFKLSILVINWAFILADF